MPFAPNTRSRSWMVTIQVANMENAGLTKEEYENAELLANFMIETWEHSGKDRTAGISVCRSSNLKLDITYKRQRQIVGQEYCQ